MTIIKTNAINKVVRLYVAWEANRKPTIPNGKSRKFSVWAEQRIFLDRCRSTPVNRGKINGRTVLLRAQRSALSLWRGKGVAPFTQHLFQAFAVSLAVPPVAFRLSNVAVHISKIIKAAKT